MRVAASANGEALCARYDLDFVPIGGDFEAWLAANHAVSAADRLAALQVVRKTLSADIDEQFRVLCAEAADVDFVLGAGLVNAAASAAELAGVPFAFAAYCSQAIPSADHAPYFTPSLSAGKLANRVLWAANLKLVEGQVLGHMNRNREARGLRPLRKLIGHIMPPERLLLAADAAFSPPPVDYSPHIVETGFWRLDSGEPLTADIAAFIEAGEPPVYLGFGSMTHADPSGAAAAVRDAVARAGVRALVSTAGHALAALPARDDLLVIGAAPHEALFPRLAGVVHHGGAGTTAAAAAAGVPQLAVPHTLDQPYWARAIRHLGVGPAPLPWKRLDVPSLAARLRALVDDGDARARAHSLGAQLRARDSLAEASATIERWASTPPRHP